MNKSDARAGRHAPSTRCSFQSGAQFWLEVRDRSVLVGQGTGAVPVQELQLRAAHGETSADHVPGYLVALGVQEALEDLPDVDATAILEVATKHGRALGSLLAGDAEPVDPWKWQVLLAARPVSLLGSAHPVPQGVLTEEALTRLAPRRDCWTLLLSRPDLPDSVAWMLFQAMHGSSAMLDRVPDLERWLPVIATCSHPSQRSFVAQHEATEQTLLRLLADDPDVTVRLALTRRPGPLALEVLEVLVTDTVTSVRRAVAQREQHRLDDRIQWSLATDTDVDVRLDLARRRGRRQTEMLSVLAADVDDRVRATVAAHEHVKVETLRLLASDDAAQVRQAVAARPRVPSEVLTRLASDENAGVRAVVAARPRLTAALVRILANDPDRRVVKTLMHFRHPDAQLAQQIVAAHPDDDELHMLALRCGSVVDFTIT